MRFPLFSVAMLTLATGAMAEVPVVVADIAPVHSLVATVMAGVGEPSLLVDAGASPHGYALRPSKAAALDRADAVFWIGEGLDPWLVGPLSSLAQTAKVVELMDVPGTTLLEFREGASFEGHDHTEEAHESVHEDHGDIDPHGWLDPINARLWLGTIAEELSRLDPENAETYAKNAALGQAELDDLIGQIDQTLAPFRGTPFIVFHDAFHYFENRFAVSAAGAISLSDATDPGARRIAQIRQTVTDMGVACVFTEPQFNPGLVTAVAATGVQVAQLDPLGVALKPGPTLYAQMMHGLAADMLRCK